MSKQNSRYVVRHPDGWAVRKPRGSARAMFSLGSGMQLTGQGKSSVTKVGAKSGFRISRADGVIPIRSLQGTIRFRRVTQSRGRRML